MSGRYRAPDRATYRTSAPPYRVEIEEERSGVQGAPPIFHWHAVCPECGVDLSGRADTERIADFDAGSKMRRHRRSRR